MAVRSTSPDMTTIIHARLHGKFIQIQCNLKRKKLHRTNQGSNFGNRNVRVAIQFIGKRKPQHLKRLFPLKNRPIHFYINSTSVIRPVKQNKSSFSSIGINKPLSCPSPLSCRSDSSSEANSSCCHRSNTWSHLE